MSLTFRSAMSSATIAPSKLPTPATCASCPHTRTARGRPAAWHPAARAREGPSSATMPVVPSASVSRTRASHDTTLETCAHAVRAPAPPVGMVARCNRCAASFAEARAWVLGGSPVGALAGAAAGVLGRATAALAKPLTAAPATTALTASRLETCSMGTPPCRIYRETPSDARGSCKSSGCLSIAFAGRKHALCAEGASVQEQAAGG